MGVTVSAADDDELTSVPHHLKLRKNTDSHLRSSPCDAVCWWMLKLCVK